MVLETLRSKLLSLEIPSVEELPVSSKEAVMSSIVEFESLGAARGLGRIGASQKAEIG